jgi:hypothetical protein
MQDEKVLEKFLEVCCTIICKFWEEGRFHFMCFSSIKKKKNHLTGHQWIMSIFLATWEAEIRKIMVQVVSVPA